MKLADCKVYQTIKKSKKLRKDTKAKALRGIRKMVKDEFYAKEVEFSDDSLVSMAFFWDVTDEGFDFWERVDEKIEEEQE